jgi:hypothetical protein
LQKPETYGALVRGFLTQFGISTDEYVIYIFLLTVTSYKIKDLVVACAAQTGNYL